MTKGLTRFIESAALKVLPRTAHYFKDRLESLEQHNDYLQESLSRLELEIENEGYYRLTQLAEYQFDRKRLGDIVKLAVQMAIKNPITNRSVNVQADYVFGQGVRFVAKNDRVQEVIDEFVEYKPNQKVLTGATAQRQRERDLQIQGNLFFALFTNYTTGRVTVRMLDVLDIDDIIRDPDDYSRELFIRRHMDGPDGSKRAVYHPAYGIDQDSVVDGSRIKNPWEYQPEKTEEGAIIWNAPVLHAGPNKFGKEKFAIPEIYPQLDWALAYKRFLEDWTSIIRAFARMALKITGLSGKRQAAAAKSLMGTSVSLSNPIEKNPSAAGGSLGLFGKGVDIEPVKTAGATTPASDGQPVLNMACAAHGLPNTFYGDASVGNYATAQTLDRPTELKMIGRRSLWIEIFNDIFEYVIKQAAVAPEGLLSDISTVTIQPNPFTGEPEQMVEINAGEDGDEDTDTDDFFEVVFPELLERNVTDRVRALVNAVTMFGKPLTDIIPDKRFVARLLLEALNVPNVEQLIPAFVKMWEKNLTGEPGKPVDAITIPNAPPPGKGGAEDPSQGGDVGANG